MLNSYLYWQHRIKRFKKKWIKKISEKPQKPNKTLLHDCLLQASQMFLSEFHNSRNSLYSTLKKFLGANLLYRLFVLHSLSHSERLLLLSFILQNRVCKVFLITRKCLYARSFTILKYISALFLGPTVVLLPWTICPCFYCAQVFLKGIY